MNDSEYMSEFYEQEAGIAKERMDNAKTSIKNINSDEEIRQINRDLNLVSEYLKGEGRSKLKPSEQHKEWKRREMWDMVELHVLVYYLITSFAVLLTQTLWGLPSAGLPIGILAFFIARYFSVLEHVLGDPWE